MRVTIICTLQRRKQGLVDIERERDKFYGALRNERDTGKGKSKKRWGGDHTVGCFHIE